MIATRECGRVDSVDFGGRRTIEPSVFKRPDAGSRHVSVGCGMSSNGCTRVRFCTLVPKFCVWKKMLGPHPPKRGVAAITAAAGSPRQATFGAQQHQGCGSHLGRVVCLAASSTEPWSRHLTVPIGKEQAHRLSSSHSLPKASHGLVLCRELLLFGLIIDLGVN